jgi:hypothetical protein
VDVGKKGESMPTSEYLTGARAPDGVGLEERGKLGETGMRKQSCVRMFWVFNELSESTLCV